MTRDMFEGETPDLVESLTGWRPSRRVMLKAAAAFSALAATGGAVRSDLVNMPGASAQSGDEILARRWSEVDELGQISIAEASDYRTIPAEFTFYAVGGSWAGSFGYNAQLEFRFSSDGTNYSAPIRSGPMVDSGRPTRDGRVFVTLVFTNGERFIQYRALDGSGNPISAPDIQIVYIDGTNGPHPGVSAAALPTLQKPSIISRAGWGAPESYRFDQYGEVWPAEYREVRHIVVHHSDTPNYETGTAGSDRVRQIYSYHARELEWGDIGYNFVVDWQGRIYEGRYGGPNVVGGHAYKYAFGSSGICVLGTFSEREPPDAAVSSLIAITAWVGRNLDPVGLETFHEVANCPVICGHRDVSQSDCPGGYLYADLSSIRNAVKDVLDDTDSPAPDPVPGYPANYYKAGDNLVTDRAMWLKSLPNSSSDWNIVYLAAGTPCSNTGLPRTVSGQLWYYVKTPYNAGYLRGDYLDPAPTGSAPSPKFAVGDRVRTTQYVEVRRDPGNTQTITGTYGEGTLLTISVDSVVSGGVRWWGVYNSTQAGGWVNQAYLTSANLSKITVSPTRATPGATVTLNLSGFPANRSVAVKFDGSTKFNVTTNGSGAASKTYALPSAVRGGHTFSATTGSSTASIPFEIVPKLSLSDSSAPVGTVLTATVRGFEAGQRLYVRWKTKNGWLLDRTEPWKPISSIGSATVQVTIPDWAKTKVSLRADTNAGSSVERAVTVETGPTTAENDGTATVTPTTPSRERTPRATRTPRPTRTPRSSEPEPTQTPEEPTSTPQPTETPTQEPTETPTPEPTETPSPEPTATSEPPSESGNSSSGGDR